MRTETVPLAGGGTVELIVPETPADARELRRRQKAGDLLLDDRLSLGDDRPRPADRPRRRRRRRGG